MAVKSASRSPLVSSLTDQEKRWESVYQHLERGEYEQVISDLRKLSETESHADQPYLESMIKTAYQLCLACVHFQEEVDWHIKARAESDSREGELLRHLYSVLHLIEADSKLDPGFNAERDSISPISTTSLRARLQSFLGIITQKRIQNLESSGILDLISNGTDSVFDTRSDSGEQLSLQLLSETDSITEQEKDTEIISVQYDNPIAPQPALESKSNQVSPFLVVYCLGPFRVYQNEQQITDWRSTKGKTIFKYLIAHRERPIAKEVLMDTFWPEAHPDAARNNLNVAIYGLRQAFRMARPSYSHIIFEYDSYMLNPELQIWVDYETFLENLSSGQKLEQRGELEGAMNLYSAAVAHYQGEFMEEDRYEDWPTSTREHLRENYLDLLDRLSRYYFDQTDTSTCTTMCRKILAIDPCREEAHRRLMRCYLHHGQPYLALRQYHLCEEALQKELDISPMEETLVLYQTIRTGEHGID